MKYHQTDGGRKDAGYRGTGGDCVTRAIAIATCESYKKVRDALTELTKEMTGGLETSAANGVTGPVSHRYLNGYELVLTKGQYLKDLPKRGTYIACLPSHYVAVLDGTVHDSWDSRESKRTKCKSPTMEGYYVINRGP